MFDSYLSKLKEFGNLTDNQIFEIKQNISQGVFYYILAESEDLISQEIKNKVQNINIDNPNTKDINLIINALLKEVSETKQGQGLIKKRVNEALTEVTNSLSNKITQTQKSELSMILSKQSN